MAQNLRVQRGEALVLDHDAVEVLLGRRDLRVESPRACRARMLAAATPDTHLWSAGTTYHGAHFVDVAVIAAS